jgi:WD40 repeat protein
MFAVAGWDGVVNLWGASQGRESESCTGPAGRSSPWPLTPDSQRLVAGNELGRLQVWNVATGDVLSTTKPPIGAFWRIFGAFWEGSVTDTQSEKQLITIVRTHVYHRRKRGSTGRDNGTCDVPTR